MWEQASALLDQMRENGLMLVILHMATVFFQYRDKKGISTLHFLVFPVHCFQSFPVLSTLFRSTPFHSVPPLFFSFFSPFVPLSAFPFSSFPSVPLLWLSFLLFSSCLIVPWFSLVSFLFFLCFSCFFEVFTFVSFCFFSLFFHVLLFYVFQCFPRFHVFPYLVDFHMLTIGSTTSNFPVHFITPFRCVVLCSVPLAFPAFFSSLLHFFPFHFFHFPLIFLSSAHLITLPLFHLSVFHSNPSVHSCSYSCSSSPIVIPVPSRLHSILFFFIPFLSTSVQFNTFLLCSVPFHPIPLHSIRFTPSPLHSTPLRSSAVHFVSFRSKRFRITPLALIHYFLSFSCSVVRPLLFFFLLPFIVVLFHACSLLYISFQSIPLHSSPCVH